MHTEIKKKKTHKEEQVMTFISCIVNVKKYQKYQLQKYQLQSIKYQLQKYQLQKYQSNDQMNS